MYKASTTHEPTMTLPIPSALACSADQARKMGLKIGDTIQCLHKCGRYELYQWHELRITLIRIDQYYTDWVASERDDGLTWDNKQGPWSDPYKTKNCRLAYRAWKRVETPPEHVAFRDDPVDDHQAA